ncbi:hypothetical protein AAFX24_20400 [Vibrio mediterranei]|uniref:hypothetical protein n=1 Tax=Vibrio mediterranei TaxID=689 RepID=UPI0038CF1C47
MEDIEIPQHVYEMETDELIEWLSEDDSSSDNQDSPTLNDVFEPNTTEDASNLLLHYLESRRNGEQPDARVSEFVYSVLERVSKGEQPWRIGRGEVPISFPEERWRGAVIGVLIELGATHRQIAEMLLVSTRTIDSWAAYSKRNIGRDFEIYENIMSYLEEHCKKGIERKDYREICAVITRWKEIRYKPRRRKQRL